VQHTNEMLLALMEERGVDVVSLHERLVEAGHSYSRGHLGLVLFGHRTLTQRMLRAVVEALERVDHKELDDEELSGLARAYVDEALTRGEV
jgi:hypothetical protein